MMKYLTVLILLVITLPLSAFATHYASRPKGPPDVIKSYKYQTVRGSETHHCWRGANCYRAGPDKFPHTGHVRVTARVNTDDWVKLQKPFFDKIDKSAIIYAL